ncbi:MAG: tRNA glutamyl-Q(34) synthetase GluQRS [Bradymonadia bacterium]
MIDPAFKGAGRFAPTPTGPLHLGNARTALLAWLWARASGLRNVLRVEDLDPRAIPAGCLEGQYADLQWMGLTYDESPTLGGPVGPYRQSERSALYREALTRLDELGLLYPCWCSRREVREAARAPHASDEGPVYPGTCRHKTPVGASLGDFDALPDHNGRRPAIRLDVGLALDRLGNPGPVVVPDLIAGDVAYDVRSHMGDFVVRRVDGIAAYQLACALDDHLMGCTQVLRGDDLLPSTARQLIILDILGLPRPRYAHPGLVLGPDGTRLAKRDRAVGLTALRSEGVEAAEVVQALAEISGLPATSDLDVLTGAFELTRIPQHPVSLKKRLSRSG